MFKRTLSLAAWIFAFQLIAFFIHQYVHFRMSDWYELIQKSPLSLPEFIFPLIWSTLYVMMTIAGFLMWQERTAPHVKLAIRYYVVSIVMTWAWLPIIFKLHWVGFGFFWTLGIFIATLGAVVNAAETLEFPASLLSPYLLWLLYVTYLCGYMWLNN